MRSANLRLALATTALLTTLGSGIAFADQDIKMEMSDFKFAPNTATIRVGEKVKFTLPNVGQRPHDLHIEGPGVEYEVVPGGGNIAAGQTGSGELTFTTPGEYQFWCPVGNHRAQGMVGTFQVVAVGAAGASAALPRSGEPSVPVLALLGVAGAATVGGIALRRRPS